MISLAALTISKRSSFPANRQHPGSARFSPVRFSWRVTDAYDLAPINTHDLNRFERYSVPGAKFQARLPELFPTFLEAARRLDLAHASTMLQPEQNLVGALTAATQENRQVPTFETVTLHRRADLARFGV
jgi:hypothetical protein